VIQKDIFMRGELNKEFSQVRNGKWKEFNKRAVLIAEGHYVNNRKHGVWREYYDSNGSLMIEEVYNHGIQHGRFASYHPNGQLLSEGTSYHPNGQLLSEGKFHNGMREGYFKVYDEEGNNIRNILFINNNEIEDVEYKSTGT
jgi:hypothetical protein